MQQSGDVSTESSAESERSLPDDPGGTDRVIGGVAGRIADRLGLDALWVRLGFVVLGLAGGLGLVVYGAWWLVLVAGTWSRSLRITGGTALLVVVPWWIARGPDAFATGPVAVVLLFVGLALALWQPRRQPVHVATAAPATVLEVGWPAPTAAAHPEQHSWRVPPAGRGRRAPRGHSLLGRSTLAGAIVIAAVWALADQLDGGRLHPEQWLGAAAVVCGAGLLVGVVRGRARWLIVPAVIAAGSGYVCGTLARVGIPATDLTGDRYVSIGEYTQHASYRERVGVGNIWINVDAPGSVPVHVDARVGFGDIHLTVGPDVTVELRADVDHGSVRGPGVPPVQPGPSLRVGDGATPDVVIDARVGRGGIEVQTYESSPFPSDTTTVPALARPDLALPDVAGELVAVRDGVAMTTDGWVVIGDAEALISPTDEVTLTAPGGPPPDEFPLESFPPRTARAHTIETWRGPFTLLPRSLLVTPDGEVLDLVGLRAEIAGAAPALDRSPPPVAAPDITTADGATGSTPAPPADTTIRTTTMPPASAPLATIPGG